MDNEYIMPPQEMRVRVTASADPAYFVSLGLVTLAEMLPLAMKPGHSGATRWSTILDFGCGPGRLTQWLAFNPSWIVYGCDIDAEAIAWATENIPAAAFKRVQPEPKLPYGDGMFDLIIASDVFSHIPGKLIEPWLAELHRVLAVGGTLVFSFHGPSEHPEPVASVMCAPEGTIIPGVPPESYVVTYCNAQWLLLGVCAKYFEVKHYEPRGFCGHQDLIAVSKIK